MNIGVHGRAAAARGFTLLEILIAITILAVGIMAIVKLFPTSLRNARIAAERTLVAELASSRLGRVQAAGAESLFRDRFNPRALLSLSAVDSIHNTYSLYNGYQTTVQRLQGAAEVYLQRVTFSVQMDDGRSETFVTYVATR